MRADERAARVSEFGEEGAVGREVHAGKVAHGAHRTHGKNRVGFFRGLCCVAGVGNPWTEQPIFFVDFEGLEFTALILKWSVIEVEGSRNKRVSGVIIKYLSQKW